MQKLNLKITGMHCGACATAIEMYLSNQNGISSAKVDFDNKSAQVEIDESKITGEKIAKEVSEIGFGASVV